MSGMLTQTGALFLDAYREINSKKMFWVTLFLSALVVAAFAGVGINDRGIKIFAWDFPGIYNTKFITPATFYKLMFSALGVGWWLNVFAIGLALASTAGIIPEFVAGGSIDLYLSKPVSRLRLWLTKYATGVVFVGLQVLVFTIGCFFLIGIRGGSWDLRVFLAVPIVVLVFSYLFCVCALLGLVTRSTIAALLLTLMIWFLIFGVHVSELTLLIYRTAGKMENDAYSNQFAYIDKQLESLTKQSNDSTKAQLEGVKKQRQELEEKKRKSDPTRQNVITAHSILHTVKTALPKTAETSDLLTRWLHIDTEALDDQELNRMERRKENRARRNGWLSSFQDRTEIRNPPEDPEVVAEVGEIVESRKVRWVLGTSVTFEAVILALGAWIFCRRDY